MRYTPRLLLALVLLQLWGCAFERRINLKCAGDCTLEVDKAIAFEPPVMKDMK